MFSNTLLSWLSGNHGLMTLLAENWLLGTLIVGAVIFCETGLVILPFLPGDSLLFATGAFLGINGLSPVWAILITATAAVLGDATNYLIGRSALGRQLLKRDWIRPRHLEKASTYFTRFGAPTITIGRFIPVVRTIAPFLAGLSGMCPRRFALYNLLGAVLWCSSLLLTGYWLGGVTWIKAHMSSLSLGVVALSVLPVLWGLKLGVKRGALVAGG